jgi:carboxypeptidase family protein
MRRAIIWTAGLGVLLATLRLINAQSTQSVLLGAVTDSVSGQPIKAASVECRSEATGLALSVPTDASGHYIASSLSAGTYIVTVRAEGYQTQQARAVEILVASRIELNFRVRPLSDLWEAGQYQSWQMPESKQTIGFYGPDVDNTRVAVFDPNQLLTGLSSLQSGVSYAIDPVQLSDLPLSGQNVYQLLAFQPGVTSVLSVNGRQSSLFLLDGIEGAPAFGPEFVQEYRVSTGTFSAEFGRTTGFVANAITKAGSNALHGLLYTYFNNEALNANAFQSNYMGNPRQRYRELFAGTWIGGPLIRDRTFFSAGYEQHLTNTSEYPFTFHVPVLNNFRDCAATANSQALMLLERFPPPLVPTPAGPPCDHLSGPYTFSIPVKSDRGLALARIDQLLRGGKDHLMLRAISSRETDPDSIFSLYPDFTSAQNVNTTSVSFDGTHIFNPKIVTDFRAGWNHFTNDLPRAHQEIPTLTVTTDGNQIYASGISLPGVLASVAAQRTRQDTTELSDSTIVSWSRHIITFGAGAFIDRAVSSDAYLQSGNYQFANLLNFGEDKAYALEISVARNSLSEGGFLVQPDYSQHYRRFEFFGFLQDNFRVTRRFSINFGLRYDGFSAPQYRSAVDTYISLGSGSAPIQDALQHATFVFGPGCCRSAFEPDRTDWAPRLALAYDFTGSGKHVFRAGYGIFYDRTPDISTIANNVEVVGLISPNPDPNFNVNYSQPVLTQASNLLLQQNPALSPPPVLVARALAAPLVQSWYAGVQQLWSTHVAVEVNYQGSAGDRLITTDDINRTDATDLNSSRLNPSLPDINYLSNVGFSRYNAGTGLVRYRSRLVLFQAAYTLSHSIDNNSGYFTRQFDAQLDRGNSDFDQRQNLVVYGVLHTPSSVSNRYLRRVTEDWQIGFLMGLRSGFPYTIFADAVPGAQPCDPNAVPGSNPVLYQNRASLIPGVAPLLSHPVAVPGGVQLLSPAAFCLPVADSPGNLGRNSFIGPGSWNTDMSLGRSFRLPWLGEAGRIQLRADFYNVFNHPNLGDPIVSNTGFGVFGQAFYGSTAAPPSGVSFVPLDQTPRRIELQVRVFF